MVLNKPESSDSIAKNALVAPQGGYFFLKIALRETPNGPLVPLDADWASQGSSLVSVKDPDGTPLAWGTNTLDPGDASDDFDENRTSYVGDQVAPEIVGLHATLDGQGRPVRLALKLKATGAAEITNGDSLRNYSVTWNLKRNGVVVPITEDFNIGPAATASFLDGVSIAELKLRVKTTLPDDDLEDIIAMAVGWAKGMLDSCDIDPDALTDLPRLVKEAIILKASGYVIDFDASAGGLVTMRKEGSKQIRYSASSDKLSASLHKRAEETINAYCKRHGPAHRIRFNTFRQRPNDGQFKRPGTRDLFE